MDSRVGAFPRTYSSFRRAHDTIPLATQRLLLSSIVALWCFFAGCNATAERNQLSLTNIPVAAPIDTDSAGKAGDIAINSVIRIVCPKEDLAGTGFLHKSGNVITAEHVVRDCSQVLAIAATGTSIKASIVQSNMELDLAILALQSPLRTKTLSISSRSNFSIGTQVTTWGFPGGYSGRVPLLSVGYLSGLQTIKAASGRIIQQWIVNAAFNRGNSGGPLLHIETGEVIGVVSSKIAPISRTAQHVLDVLAKTEFGVTYEAKGPDGSTKSYSQGQVVGMVLDELRKQVQLVIGTAVLVDDIRKFLKDQGIDP
jgi:S1-C subfamily serine protease